MKYTNSFLIVLISIFLSSFSGCDPDSIDPVDVVSEDDNLGLVYMREEEKLARDVYITLFEIYGNNVFSNISNAEQQHMDQLLVLLLKYDIQDPSIDKVGEFHNQSLQQLYNDLIEQGSESETAALIVGATIEDLDIKDLDEFTLETTDPDIITVYNSLNCGSRNHMRAFNTQLESLGVSYVPQFISQEKFDSIIDGEHERCG